MSVTKSPGAEIHVIHFLHTDIGSPFLQIILVFFELFILFLIIYCSSVRSFDVKITIAGLR